MKKYFSLTVIICLLILNFSFAQDLEPFDHAGENSILTEETNYEMELVFEDENIIWAIEFFEDNSILATVKSGSRLSAWGTIPVRCRISRRLLSILSPKILRTPEVLGDCPRTMRKVVVLPAPLGPKRPKQLPRGISRSSPETASRSPYTLRRPRHMIIRSAGIGVTEAESLRSGNAFNCSSMLEIGSVPVG